jgi:hypothetical protein
VRHVSGNREDRARGEAHGLAAGRQLQFPFEHDDRLLVRMLMFGERGAGLALHERLRDERRVHEARGEAGEEIAGGQLVEHVEGHDAEA